MRRIGLAILVGIFGLLPCAAHAQTHRIGILSPGVPASEGGFQQAPFVAALRDLGYEDGRNLIIERRYAREDILRLPALAQELVQLKIAVLVVQLRKSPCASANGPVICQLWFSQAVIRTRSNPS